MESSFELCELARLVRHFFKLLCTKPPRIFTTILIIILQVRIRVSDLLGRSLGRMDVTVESAMRSSDGLTIMSNTKMLESKNDHTVYEVDMMKAKPARGFYDLTINAGI